MLPMSILPIIHMSDLQRSPKKVFELLRDYAVIQSHGRDRAFVLHPDLGRILLESGMLDALRKKHAEQTQPLVHARDGGVTEKELTDLIGNVLRELSKR